MKKVKKLKIYLSLWLLSIFIMTAIFMWYKLYYHAEFCFIYGSILYSLYIRVLTSKREVSDDLKYSEILVLLRKKLGEC